MSGDGTGLAALLERYRTLGFSDRKAVRRNLSPSELEALENACVEFDKAKRAEQSPERQFRGYSSWLASLIEQALGNNQSHPGMTAACCAAIASSHLSMLDDRNDQTVAVRLARLLGIASPVGVAAGVR